MPFELPAAVAAPWKFGPRLAALALGVTLASSLHAQQPFVPRPSPTPVPKPHTYIRFWNMLIGQKAPDLQLMEGPNKPLTSATAGNFYAGYLALDPASYNFTVQRENNPSAVIKQLPIIMRQDVYVTLLAAAGKDGKPDVQIIDDTVNPKTDDGLGKIVVRQFFPGASVKVSVGQRPASQPLAFGDTVSLEGLPIGDLPINVQATGLAAGDKLWPTEADFAHNGHHATLLVVPDPYGRFRPRLVFDGSSPNPTRGSQSTP